MVLVFPLILILVSELASASPVEHDFSHCEKIVKRWTSEALQQEIEEDKHVLRDLLFFLHVPRTGGRTYFHCFLRKLYSNSQECPRSYDKLRFDPSKQKCRLLVTHDDYSMMSKLRKERTSMVTILRNLVDRVVSTYQFSVEVAARFLVHPNLTSAMRMASRLRPRNGGVSTLDIWPWKYLVPWMREDLFAQILSEACLFSLNIVLQIVFTPGQQDKCFLCGQMGHLAAYCEGKAKRKAREFDEKSHSLPPTQPPNDGEQSNHKDENSD